LGDIVCISPVRWDFVWQRPQHLLSCLSEYGRVLFVEEPVIRPGLMEPYLEVIPGHSATDVTVLRLIQPVTKPGWVGHGDPLTQSTYSHLVAEYLWREGFTDPVLWLYTPLGLGFVETIPHSLLVYDVLEPLAPDLLEKEEILLGLADFVFARCTGISGPFTPRPILFRAGLRRNISPRPPTRPISRFLAN
jgi:UDP-galactopyranose mutase